MEWTNNTPEIDPREWDMETLGFLFNVLKAELPAHGQSFQTTIQSMLVDVIDAARRGGAEKAKIVAQQWADVIGVKVG